MKHQSIQELFSQTAARYRDNTAIISQDKQYSYGELEDRADTIANYLIANGAQKGSLVGILAKDSFHVISSIIGILKAGCVFVPLNRQLPQKRLAAMVSLIAPEWFIIESRYWPILSSVTVDAAPKATVICVDGDAVTNNEQHLVQAVDYKNYFNAEKPSVESEADDMAYIYFTSGSTGQPKAIAGRLQGIDHYIRWEQEALGVGEGVRVSRLQPISFDASLRDIFLPLCSGGITVGPAPRETVLQARKLVEWLEQHEINVIHCVPSLFRSIVNETLTPERLPALKYILMAGEALLPSDVGRWVDVFGDRVQLINLYGASETTMTKFVYFVQPADRERPSIPIGKPMEGAKAVLVNVKGRPSAPGMIGEIYVRSPYCSLGYYNQPELTSAAFIANPFGDNSGEIVYKTGDLGRVLEDGNYEFLGRKDQQVKIRGIRVELGEIENLLRGHDSVRDVAVIDRDDASGFKYLCAYVVLEEGTDVAELRSYLTTYLPENMIPSAFVPMQELARTISGKLDRRALPIPGHARAGLDETYVAPRTSVEELVAGIVAEVLHIERAGAFDNFFQLGGHSLLAMQLLSRVRDAFHVELPLRSLFESPTVAGLAKTIEAATRAEGKPIITPIVPVPRDGELPLSFAQERMWFLYQMEPESYLYNITHARTLSGALNIPALEQTFSEIIRRHEVLRTSFRIGTSGQPVQIIEPPEPVKLVPVDFSQLPATEQKARVRELVNREARKPFDLSQTPLLRVALIRLSEQEHVVFFTMHHIVADAWSENLLRREIGHLYKAFSEGQPSPLAELPVQYADFAVWQKQWMESEVVEEQFNYWKEQLGDLPVLELPLDRPRPAIQTYAGSAQRIVLSESIAQAIKRLNREEGVTLFMTVLAAFQTLLHRYNGQDEIIVGTGIANRNRAEIEGLLGYFVNTLALRVDLSGNPTFRELLGRVREVTLGASAHQDLPFELLVEKLQPARTANQTPLFQVWCETQVDEKAGNVTTGLTMTHTEYARQTAHFDLMLFMTESDRNIGGHFEFNTDLFERDTISEMTRHFVTLLESVSANPGVRLLDIPLGETETDNVPLVCADGESFTFETETNAFLFEEEEIVTAA